MPSIYLSHNPQFSPLSEIVSLCLTYGFGIELSAFSDIKMVEDTSQIGIHRNLIKQIQLRSIHAPYLDLYPGGPDSAMREKTFRCFEQVHQIALQLEARQIIFHHNYDPSACSPAVWVNNSVEFWQRYLADKSNTLHCHLENIMDESPELISSVVEQVDSPNLDVALDIGHVHAYSKRPLLEWIENLGAKIGYVHLHDNHGKEDEHLGLGQGNIPLVETLAALCHYAPEAVWCVESGGEKMYQSIRWLRENQNHCEKAPLE